MSTNESLMTHGEVAQRLLEALRAMQGNISGFTIPPTPLDRQARVRGHRSYPESFFIAFAVALESSPQLAAALQAAGVSLTPAEIRDMLRYCDAYLPIADELERFARAIRHSVGLRRAKVGRVAASAYKVAQGLNLLADVPQPVRELDSMRRAFISRRRKATEPAPAARTTA